MKKVIYHDASGNLVVLALAKKSDVGKMIPQVLSMTDEEFEDWIIAKDVPVGSTEIHKVNDGDFPGNRLDRDCWVFDKVSNKVIVDPVKKSNKEAVKNFKESKKQAILSKLKISKEEAVDLMVVING